MGRDVITARAEREMSWTCKLAWAFPAVEVWQCVRVTGARKLCRALICSRRMGNTARCVSEDVGNEWTTPRGPKSSETPFCKGNPSSNGFECAGVVDWLSPVLFESSPPWTGGQDWHSVSELPTVLSTAYCARYENGNRGETEKKGWKAERGVEDAEQGRMGWVMMARNNLQWSHTPTIDWYRDSTYGTQPKNQGASGAV